MSDWIRRLRLAESDLDAALRWAWLALPVAALLVLFAPGLLSGKAPYWGTVLFQFYPWRSMAVDLVRQGALPLWNPLVGGGAPLLANYQTGVFYPPNWLHLLMPVEITIGLLAALHVLWAAMGMRFYLRRIGVDALGQGVGALAFGLSGYLISRQIFPSIGVVAPWLPWLMWALDGLLLPDLPSQVRPGRAGILALVIAMTLLGGHAQTAYYSLLYGCAYALWRVLTSTEDARQRLGLAALLTLAGLTGVALALAQLAPTLELLSLSQRAGGAERAFVMTYSFWPPHFATLLSPNLFGSPARGDYFGVRPYWEDAVYVGLLTLGLNLRSIWRWAGSFRGGQVISQYRPVPFLLAGIPLIWLLALGDNSPVFPWLYDHVPTFDAFQAPARWLLLVVFGMAALGGIGAHAWSSRPRARQAAARTISVGLAIAVSAAAILVLLGETLRPALALGFLRLGLLLATLGGLALLLRASESGRFPRSAWGLAVLFVLLLDLCSAHRGLLPMISRVVYAGGGDLAQQLDLDPGQRVVMSPQGESELQIDHSITFEDFQSDDLDHWLGVRGTLLPNTGMIDGVSSLSNFDPLRPAWHVEALESLDGLPVEAAAARTATWNAAIYLSLDGCDSLDTRARSGPVSACAVEDPWPRVFVADCDSAGECLPGGAGQASILQEGPNGAVTIEASSDRATHLVLLDTFYPGWEARVNGKPAAITRVNGAWRGVALPAGASTVEFSYHPPSLRIGLIGSAMGLLTCLALLLWRSKAQG